MLNDNAIKQRSWYICILLTICNPSEFPNVSQIQKIDFEKKFFAGTFLWFSVKCHHNGLLEAFIKFFLLRNRSTIQDSGSTKICKLWLLDIVHLSWSKSYCLTHRIASIRFSKHILPHWFVKVQKFVQKLSWRVVFLLELCLYLYRHVCGHKIAISELFYHCLLGKIVNNITSKLVVVCRNCFQHTRTWELLMSCELVHSYNDL